MSLYTQMREYFDPQLAERKRRAEAAAIEAERRKRHTEYAAEVGALAASPVLNDFKMSLIQAGQLTEPGNGMDAAGAYWYRRGLEHAERMLDNLIATAQEDD